MQASKFFTAPAIQSVLRKTSEEYDNAIRHHCNRPCPVLHCPYRTPCLPSNDQVSQLILKPEKQAAKSIAAEPKINRCAFPVFGCDELQIDVGVQVDA